MARDPQQRPEIAELIRRIEDSRANVGNHVAQLRRSLDVPSRIKHSVTSSPLAWFGGSLGAGVLASRIFRRKPKKVATKSKGIIGLLIATIMTMVKPAIRGILVSELQRRFKVHTKWQNPSQETHLPLSKPRTPPSN
ncbi:hypothetical protein ACFQY0_17070 [Haloferula chungangensis]|uniref:DUF3618 domain-containing protein n=1 Tax=Haloferula chungangensis TaxID=1048331 RepID=A0ABW2L918_9BACT